jgi:hypothetical protein
MNVQYRIRNLLVGLFTLVTWSALSQGVTTASLNGQITNSDGEPMPGASVIALHRPTGTPYGTSSRSDGRFNLPNLRVGGPYTITVSFIGFQEEKIEGIFLALGQTLTMDFTLKEEATQLGEVVIQAEDNVFNSGRTGSSVNFDADQIRRLPTITRSAADIYRLTPSSDGNSFAGRNDQFNNFSLNGAIFGGQTDAQPISLDAIDQIQVSIASYDVTQSGYTGASVNAVTKSGTNTLTGTAFGFYRNQGLTGSKVDGKKIIVPDLKQLQAGFSIGGPIVKDKLFYFVNFELERREDQGTTFISNKPGRTGENVSRVDEADLIAVANALRSIGYEPGPYEGYIHDTDNQKGIIKIDWNVNKNHTFTAIYNFLDASKQKPAHPAALGRRGPDATTLQFFNSGYQINNKISSVIGELKSIFGNRYSNKFQIGYTHFDDSRDPLSTPFPVLNINRDGIRYIVAGHEPFSINNRLDQKVFQVSNNFDIYAGQHNITAGVSFEKFQFDNSFNLGVYEPFGVPYPGGTFGPGFNSVQDFLDYVSSGDMAAIRDYAVSVYNNNNANGEWALAETNVGQLAFYLQDKWSVGSNFTLTYGIRMDIPQYFDTKKKIEENIARNCCYDPTIVYSDENGNDVTFDHTDLPEQTPLFSPRVGFNWDVQGDQSIQVRGGSGLFTGRFPFVWVGNQVANPNFFFYNMTDKDFKFPQVWRTNIGADKRIDGGWIVSADVIYTKDINAVMVRNFGRRPPTGTLNGADNRPIYTPTDQVMVFGSPTNAYVVTNVSEGKSINTTLEVKRKWSNGLYATLAYNYLKAEDVSSIEAEISSDAYDRNPAFGHVNKPQLAPSLYGNQHRVVGTANKTFSYGDGKYATTISLFFEYAKGGRFSYTYSGDINGDGSGLNDLIYVPTDSEIDGMNFDESEATAATQRAALKAFIAQDEYLSGRRGKYAEKYAALSPWYSRYDLRILQDFNVNERHRIQFSIDILNFGNLLSSKWGVRQFPTNTQPIGVSVSGSDPTYKFDPNLKNTFTNDFSLLSRWQLQFGLRYSF